MLRLKNTLRWNMSFRTKYTQVSFLRLAENSIKIWKSLPNNTLSLEFLNRSWKLKIAIRHRWDWPTNQPIEPTRH